jgi:hypothetical protein
MLKDARFLVIALLIACALFALRFCHPHTGYLYKQQPAERNDDQTILVFGPPTDRGVPSSNHQNQQSSLAARNQHQPFSGLKRK